MRHCFRLALSAGLISTKAVSSGVNPRKSRVDPTCQPAASSSLRLLAFICLTTQSCFVLIQTTFAISNYALRSLLSCLAKDFKNHNGVTVDSVNNLPALPLIHSLQRSEERRVGK